MYWCFISALFILTFTWKFNCVEFTLGKNVAWNVFIVKSFMKFVYSSAHFLFACTVIMLVIKLRLLVFLVLGHAMVDLVMYWEASTARWLFTATKYLFKLAVKNVVHGKPLLLCQSRCWLIFISPSKIRSIVEGCFFALRINCWIVITTRWLSRLRMDCWRWKTLWKHKLSV